MANNHYEKWILKMPVGLLLLTGGIFFMYYSLSFMPAKENWVIFGLISAVSVGVGSFILGSSFINKTKSDLIKKQKARQQSGG